MVDFDSYAFAPLACRVVEVVLVDCQRGRGELRRSVLQVWDKGGTLLAEHDRIHADPEYPGFFLRENLPKGWLEIMGKGGDEPEPQAQELGGSMQLLRAQLLEAQAAKIRLRVAAMREAEGVATAVAQEGA